MFAGFSGRRGNREFNVVTESLNGPFQRTVLKMSRPDSRIDAGGRSFRKLTERQASAKRTLFPLSFMPSQSYKTGMRAFGANRSGGKRKHAAVDLYAPKGTAIRAIGDGKVIRDYPFYLGTRALEVDHGDLLVRYGEISHVGPGINPGAVVKRGQTIGFVGEMVFKSGNKMSMLHIELYQGTAGGPLTVRAAKLLRPRVSLDT